MLHCIKLTTSLLLVSVQFAGLAVAGELRQEQVPAEAEWVLHFDMEAVTGSALYREAQTVGLLKGLEDREHSFDLLRDHEIQEDSDQHIEELLAAHEFDALVDFKSLTLFGSLEEDNDAVALFELSAKAQAILEDLRAQPEYLAVEFGGLRLDAWLEDGNEVNGYLFAMPADEDGDVVVAVCEDREPLVRAVQVLQGKGPSIVDEHAGEGSQLSAQPGEGSFCYVEIAGGVPGIEGDDPTSRVFSSARAMRFDVGEHDGLFLAQFSLQADKPGEAKRVAQVILGVVALGSLAASEDSSKAQLLAELADGFSVEARGDELLADFEIDSGRIVELVLLEREERAQRKARREGKRDALRANEPK